MHRDKDANEVPAGFWRWLKERLDEKPNWTPAIDDDDGHRMNRAEVLSLVKTRMANKPYGSSTPQRAPEPAPAARREEPAPAKSLSKEPWILATVVNLEGLDKGEHVVVTKGQDGNWIAMTRNGATKRIPASEIRTSVASVRRDGIPIMDVDPEKLWATVPAPAASKPLDEPKQPTSPGNPHVLDDSKLSEEQRDIDRDFEKMMVSPRQNHMMINALAGTGKTTILKHLAWKYGGQGQQWLYLVFNTKNRIEAKDKFPDWVKVYTTNSFLGHVINSRENRGIIPATERLLSLDRGDAKGGGGKKLEKARIIVDSSTFYRLMTETYRLPDWSHIEPEIPSILRRIGVKYRKTKPGQKKDFSEVLESTLEYTVNSIRYNFKERVLTLLGLLKSFAVDPRKKDDLREEVRKVFDKYDVATMRDGRKQDGYFDTYLEDIKERIDNYKPRFKDLILDALYEILHYDFMSKNYKEEVIGAATWMLEQTLPKGTSEKWQRKDEYGRPVGRPVDLGDYRDFSDDIWFPTIFANKLKWPHFDVVLADEVQDFNEGQKIMLKKLAEAGAKIVAVGDPNQCHPAGTMISITGGSSKPIEEIKIGDEVVTYQNNKSYFPGVNTQGRKVLEIASRFYRGRLLDFFVGENKMTCTPNHRCLVRFVNEPKYCLYLMKKDERFRIGVCRFTYFNGFGVVIRSNQEGAEAAWVLACYDNEKEARIAEIVTSVKFGLPQTIFTNKGQLNPTQDIINEIYDQIGCNEYNANKCLTYFGREMQFPIWNKGNHIHCGRKSFITQACNVIEGAMQMRTFDGISRGGTWETVKLKHRNDECIVYSLKVEHTDGGKRLYIANNVVVHNSIYRFRGADNDAFNNLAEMLKDSSHDKEGWTPKTLSLNFRSRPEVLQYARDHSHVKGLQAGKKFKDDDLPAEVTHEKIKYDESFDMIAKERQEGKLIETAYIARTNQPLVSAALKLLGQGIPFAIIGKDVSGDLIKHIKKIIDKEKDRGMRDSTSVLLFRDALQTFHDDEKGKKQKFSTQKEYLANLKDTTVALTASIDAFTKNGKEDGTIRDFKQWIAEKLGQNSFDWDQSDEEASEEDLKAYQRKMEDEKPVILTTAHKSKGLEFARVFILRNDQFPHPRAKHPEELGQESNTKYVAFTRAMHQLHNLNREGQPGYEGMEERSPDDEEYEGGDY